MLIAATIAVAISGATPSTAAMRRQPGGALECDLNTLVGGSDPLVRLRELFVEALKEHPAKACQLVLRVFLHRR
ncbi:MAG: hypothetical protein WAL34_07445 [Acidobacteriaceae bacterium]